MYNVSAPRRADGGDARPCDLLAAAGEGEQNVSSVLRTHTHQGSTAHEELTIDGLRRGSWIALTAPTQQELEDVARLTSVPLDLLTAALDADESSRISLEEADEDMGHDASMLMVFSVPKRMEDLHFDTIPLGIIITRRYLITVCLEEIPVLPAQGSCTWERTRLLLQILRETASTYLRYINEMDRTSNAIEKAIRRSRKNEELFKLMDLQKGMTFFTGALRSDRAALERLLRALKDPKSQELIKVREEDEDLLEDVIVEYDQAYDMVRVYSDVLGGMMDAVASIISNDLNIVMKFLAAVTIVLAIPAVVSGLWGMNVAVPLADHPAGFALVLLLALGLSAAATIFLWRKRMF